MEADHVVESSAAVSTLHARASTTTLRVATWNIHGGIGTDGRYAPQRIVDVLHEIDADLVALQEVASRRAHERFLSDIQRATGYHIADGPLYQRSGSDFGNAILSRIPFTNVGHIDLAVAAYEPRGAIDVSIDVGSQRALRALGTHLGLRPGERREQVRRLIAAVERESPHPTLLMGDLNEWYLWGRPLRWLHSHFQEVPAAPRTFPAKRPMFALDRIWASPAGCLRRLAPHRSALTRIASDHLPLVAQIEL